MSGPEYPVGKWLPLLSYGDEEAEINMRIVRYILSHPTEIQSEEELVHMLTESGVCTTETVQDQLDVLCGSGLIERIIGDEYIFYGLSHDGKQFLMDSKVFRTASMFKELYKRTARPDSVEAAYEAERPDHPPAIEEFEETQYSDSEAWESAHDSAYRTLDLSLERVGETEFEATLVENDDGTTLSTTTIKVESTDDATGDYREMEVREPRGRVSEDNVYGIEVELDGSVYKLQPTKNGDGWHSGIERALYIFT